MRVALLFLLLVYGAAAAPDCGPSPPCSANGTCTDAGCLCNNGTLGAYCNQTALECALDRCAGRGFCVPSSARACVCSVARYDGAAACRACLVGYDLATNCTACATGWFGPMCSTTAAECGVANCSQHGACLAAGGCNCTGLYTGPTCGEHPCAPGVPDAATGFATCACPLDYLGGDACTLDCGAHGVAVGDACNCTDFYVGRLCATPPIECVNDGTLVANDRCNCTNDTFYGPDCSLLAVDCGEHGARATPTTCACLQGWSGETCLMPPLISDSSGLSASETAITVVLCVVGGLAILAAVYYISLMLRAPVGRPTPSEERAPLIRRGKTKRG